MPFRRKRMVAGSQERQAASRVKLWPFAAFLPLVVLASASKQGYSRISRL
jgi:hypothetical protein